MERSGYSVEEVSGSGKSGVWKTAASMVTLMVDLQLPSPVHVRSSHSLVSFDTGEPGGDSTCASTQSGSQPDGFPECA